MKRNCGSRECKKVVFFLWGGVLAIVSYICLVSLYVRIAADPIIFTASIAIAIITVLGCCVLLWKAGRGLFDSFSIGMAGLVYFMGILLLAVFGPTFIDRSISYHIAFYASDIGEVSPQEIKEVFSTEIFEKRMHDAVETGVLKKEGHAFVPTWKAKFVTAVCKPLGEVTGSLETYNEMKDKVQKKKAAGG